LSRSYPNQMPRGLPRGSLPFSAALAPRPSSDFSLQVSSFSFFFSSQGIDPLLEDIERILRLLTSIVKSSSDNS
ncbi:MAG: hypothetical protein WCH98_23870, partial [Verrucomicrobiota bacterium]